MKSYEAARAARPDIAGFSAEPFKFRDDIYGHQDVKNSLRAAQHYKCAYCEAYFAGNAAGDIEHFRPKAFSQQTEGAPKLYLGYYWLAYSWTNLLYSCEPCNRARKRNVFPLANPGERARSSLDSVTDERAILLDPAGKDDPRAHIGFRLNKPYARSQRGETTIRLTTLDRISLDAPKLDHLKRVRTLHILAGIDEMTPRLKPEVVSAISEARAELKQLCMPTSPFSAMTAAFLETVGLSGISTSPGQLRSARPRSQLS